MTQDGPDETVQRLRAAAAALDAPASGAPAPGAPGPEGGAARTDPSDEAERFEELHAALVAVLDRTVEDAGPSDPAPRT